MPLCFSVYDHLHSPSARRPRLLRTAQRAARARASRRSVTIACALLLSLTGPFVVCCCAAAHTLQVLSALRLVQIAPSEPIPTRTRKERDDNTAHGARARTRRERRRQCLMPDNHRYTIVHNTHTRHTASEPVSE